jgi:hypothetical protein
MTQVEFNKLVEKDLREFQNQFGIEKLNQLIKKGILPLSKETKKHLATQA